MTAVAPTLCLECGARREGPESVCPACGAPGLRREREAVRTTDLEPYTALRYIGRLFKLLSGLIIVALIGETTLGLVIDGPAALGTLLGEAMRLLALAGLLWGGGDIVRLVVGAGHDLRTARILLGRINARLHGPPSTRACG